MFSITSTAWIEPFDPLWSHNSSLSAFATGHWVQKGGSKSRSYVLFHDVWINQNKTQFQKTPNRIWVSARWSQSQRSWRFKKKQMPSSSWAFTFIPQKRWRNTTTEKKLCANHWFDIAYSDLEWHIDINSDWFLFIIVPGKADESARFLITTNRRQLQTKKMWPICSSLYFCPLKSFILNLFHSNSSQKFHASIWFGAQPPPLIALLLHLTGNLYSWEKRSFILNHDTPQPSLIRFQLGSLTSWYHPDAAAGCPAARRPAPPTCQPSRSAQRRGSWSVGTWKSRWDNPWKPVEIPPTENWHASFPMKRDDVFKGKCEKNLPTISFSGNIWVFSGALDFWSHEIWEVLCSIPNRILGISCVFG